MKTLTIFIGIIFSLIFYIVHLEQNRKEVVSTVDIIFIPSYQIQITSTQKTEIKKHNYHYFDQEEIDWMIKNVYFEARNQSETGKIAVIMVTMNRVLSPDYPNTIKEVVTQKNNRGCQFSWYCDGKPDVMREKETYEEIRQLVLTVLPVYSRIDDVTNGAMYYHANYVKPYWRKHFQKTVKIGTHIFYREKG